MVRKLFGVLVLALVLSFGAVLADTISALVTDVDTAKKEIKYKEVTGTGKDATIGDKVMTVSYDEKMTVTAVAGGGGRRGGKGGKGGGGKQAEPENGDVKLLQDRLSKAKDAGKDGVRATLT